MEPAAPGPNPADKAQGEASSSRRAEALIGRVISDRYRIEAVVGVGSMGAVYRGLHLRMRKEVAIKVLHPDTEKFPELVSRFEREAIAGAHISHPNVAAASDMGTFDGGSCFLVLEFIRGRTLRALLDEGPVPAERAASVARQLAAALGAAHDKGIVHRDVKPRNVMIADVPEGEPDVVKLIDFGFARVPVSTIAPSTDDSSLRALGESLSESGVVFGTVAYMAPETALGMRAVGPLSDLYSLGVIFYELLTGKHPFDGDDPRKLFSDHRHKVPPPLAERNPEVEVPASLEAVVMRLLEKDPDDRYEDAAEVIRAIDRAMRRSGPPRARRAEAPRRGAGSRGAGRAGRRAGREKLEPDDLTEDHGELELDARREDALHEHDEHDERDGGDGQEGSECEPDPTGDEGGALEEEERAAGEAERRRIGRQDGAASRRSGLGLAETSALPEAPRRPGRRRPKENRWLVFGLGALLAGGAYVAGREWAAKRSAGAASARPPAASAAPGPETQEEAPAEPSANAPPDGSARAEALRAVVLRGAESEAEAAEAAEALVALGAVHPGALRDASLRAAAAKTAARVADARETSPEADRVFYALSYRFGSEGLDALYDVTRLGVQSRAARRATAILELQAVSDRATPALRIAWELDRASCKRKKKLFGRAGAEGDARTLVQLEALTPPACDPDGEGCCYRQHPGLEKAITALRARTAAQ